MGWSYNYAILPDFNLEKMKQAVKDYVKPEAAKHTIEDITDIVIEAERFKNKQLMDMVATHSNGKSREENEKIWLEAIQRVHSDPKVAWYIENSEGTGDIGIATITFRKFNTSTLMFWTTDKYDLSGDWKLLAFGIVHRLGYRGNALWVHGNSVTDAASTEEMRFLDDGIALQFFEDGPEGQYEDFLKNNTYEGTNLWYIHEKLLDDDRAKPIESILSLGLKLE
jgi:hypothetical protein